MWWVPIAAAAAGSAVSGMFNAEQAEENRDWQEMMSGTAHQREVSDLRAAGLNPILSATGGRGAAVGSGAQASMPDLGATLSSAAHSAMALKKVDAEIELLHSQAGAAAAQAAKTNQESGLLGLQYQAEEPASRWTGFPEHLTPAQEAVRGRLIAAREGGPQALSDTAVKVVAQQIAQTYGLSTAKAHQRAEELLGDLRRMQERGAEARIWLDEWEANFLKQYGVLERGVRGMSDAVRAGASAVGVARSRPRLRSQTETWSGGKQGGSRTRQFEWE